MILAIAGTCFGWTFKKSLNSSLEHRINDQIINKLFYLPINIIKNINKNLRQASQTNRGEKIDRKPSIFRVVFRENSFKS